MVDGEGGRRGEEKGLVRARRKKKRKHCGLTCQSKKTFPPTVGLHILCLGQKLARFFER